MTKGKSEIEFLHKVSLRKKDFKDADEDCVAAFSLLCYAVSEVNVLQRLYLFIDHDFEGPDELNSINLFQRSVMLRIWSAKLFEVEKFVRLEGQFNKSQSSRLKELLAPFKPLYDKLRNHPGYPLVANLRNEATNHYKLKAARANLRVIPNDSDFSALLHDMEGNTLYLAGEAVMHYGAYEKQAQRSPLDEQDFEKSTFDLWMEWNFEAHELLRKVHLKFATFLIPESMSDKKADRRTLWIPEGAAAYPADRLTPFFVRKPK